MAFVNKCFLKKPPLELLFVTCCPVWEQEEQGCLLRGDKMAAKGGPGTDGAVSLPGTKQGEQGTCGDRDRSPDSAAHQANAR